MRSGVRDEGCLPDVDQAMKTKEGSKAMKFRVFGGEDAPDWLLAGIYTLSKLSLDHIQLLALEICHQILGQVFDYEKTMEITADPSLDIKACIAAVHFLMTGAARYQVDEVTLSKEAQQLGLPPELSDTFCAVYKLNKEGLHTKLSEESLRIPSTSIAGWQMQTPSNDIVLRLAQPDESNIENKRHTYVGLSYHKFRTLLQEMKTARALMEKL